MSSRELLPITRPWLGEEEAAAVARTLASGWVTQGPEVAAFEREFALRVGASEAVAVSSCTTALHLALIVAGVGHGDEVIAPSASFIATASAIRHAGAVPVFADIEADGINLDPDSVAACLGPRTRAILAVHQLGMPCDLRRLLPLAEAAGVPLIEDAACAVGSRIDLGAGLEPIGRPHGTLACFSFHPRKLLTTGDGGMITTADSETAARLRRLRHHGMSVPDTQRHASPLVIQESYDELGYNYRMTDIQAAIGRVQLGRLDDIVDSRRALAERYRELLSEIEGITLPEEPAWAQSNWQSFWIGLPERVDQRAVMQALLDQGVASRRGLQSIHREPAYPAASWHCAGRPSSPATPDCGCAAGSCRRLTRSEALTDHSLILPLFAGMTLADQLRVRDALRHALGRGERS